MNEKNLSFQIRLAERIIEIQPLYERIRFLCEDYICPEGTEPDLTIRITGEDLEREKACALKQEQKTGERRPSSEAYLETLAVYRKLASGMPAFDTFLMHGSVIATAGQGYMICAASGVGKTTRTRLWLDHIPDSLVVNGDKPLLRVTEMGVTAYGTPWCGKEGWNRNTSVPLRAVFLLERGDNEVQEIDFADAFPALMRQTFKPGDPEAKRKTLRLLTGMAGKVRVFRFRSEPDAEAVRMAWEAAGGKE